MKLPFLPYLCGSSHVGYSLFFFFIIIIIALIPPHVLGKMRVERPQGRRRRRTMVVMCVCVCVPFSAFMWCYDEVEAFEGGDVEGVGVLF